VETQAKTSGNARKQAETSGNAGASAQSKEQERMCGREEVDEKREKKFRNRVRLSDSKNLVQRSEILTFSDAKTFLFRINLLSL